jgi:hypothetical protein
MTDIAEQLRVAIKQREDTLKEVEQLRKQLAATPVDGSKLSEKVKLAYYTLTSQNNKNSKPQPPEVRTHSPTP